MMDPLKANHYMCQPLQGGTMCRGGHIDLHVTLL